MEIATDPEFRTMDEPRTTRRNRKHENRSCWTMNSDDDADEAHTRRRPNVLVTGTPGVGKTATASLLAVSRETVDENAAGMSALLMISCRFK